MQKLGLSKIDELQKRLDCQEGLLIDFDYASSLTENPTASEQTSEEETGQARREGKTGQPIKPTSGSRTVS